MNFVARPALRMATETRLSLRQRWSRRVLTLRRFCNNNNNNNNSSKHTTVSETTLAALKEELRAYGSPQDGVDLTLASSSSSSSRALQDLGTTTAIITLRNPTARNALTGKMMAELADIVTELENKETWKESLSAVLLRGGASNDNNSNNNNNIQEEPFFCAGADIRVAANQLSTRHGGYAMSTVMTDTLTRLRRLPYVTVACLSGGGAVGGGAELATATDYRFLSANAVVQFVHLRMGVSPGWGGAARLVRIVGHGRALQLLGTAQKVNAATALAMGLVDQVVPVTNNNNSSSSSNSNDDMDVAVRDFLQPFVRATHPAVLHAAKRVVVATQDADTWQEAAAAEQKVFLEMWGGPANRAALEKASAKKNKPNETK